MTQSDCCSYTTTNRGNITLGGFGFTEEMCVNYVHYYPRTELEVVYLTMFHSTHHDGWQVCKSSIDPDQLNDYFRLLSEQEGQPTSPDSTVEENYRAIR